MTESKNWYFGSCHCNKVRFKALLNLDKVYSCNCSICHKKGFIHTFAKRDQFELLTPKEHIQSYSFQTHTAKHLFCKYCGISSFYIPRSHPKDYSINVRCLENIDFDKLTIDLFNGKDWENSIAELESKEKADDSE